jgi:hypothetical protein
MNRQHILKFSILCLKRYDLLKGGPYDIKTCLSVAPDRRLIFGSGQFQMLWTTQFVGSNLFKLHNLVTKPMQKDTNISFCAVRL